ncbi:type I-B CRISPR-associated protein Cas5b [Haloimpatiens sp. FM7315]|uniref:type I-B CRISPR-associated protein Cas5b n=1 Tax=Haloimpatiens sp. FM7315 TaxID=3298609 RepID=UPI0035A39390
MDAIKFTLSGRTAFFKKPDVNTYYYFTYGNIHKIALMGILGAVNGYSGYNQQKNHGKMVYPEFYEKLKNIKIGIVPLSKNGYFPKKVQTFNNSVGYASKEQGGNLIVKEQWLEGPKWDIYILVQGDVEEELKDRLLNFRFKYIPYLGKNDHLADITNVEIIKDVKKADKFNKVDSFFMKKYFKLSQNNDEFEDEFDNEEYVELCKYQEMFPVTLEEETNKYNLETFVFTNWDVESLKDTPTYECNDKIIYFF